MLKKIYIPALFFLLSNQLYADALSAYVELCKQKLEISSIPGDYSCFSGTFIPNSTKFGVKTSNNYLGRVPILDNHSVDAVFLCRTVSGTGSTATAGLNGYILQNRDNGNACFFDAKKNKNASTRPNLDAPNAADFWQQPKFMDGTPCTQCHNPDPYIVSPGLVDAFKEQGIFYNGRNLLGPYKIVGSELPTLNNIVDDNPFYNNQAQVDSWVKDPSQNCAKACHKTSSNPPVIPIDGYMPPIPGGLYTLADPFIQNTAFRIQNYWNFNAFISLNDMNDLKADSANWNTAGAEWTFEKIENFYRIKSAKAKNEYLHMEYGRVESGPILTGWWSSQWILEAYDNNPPPATWDLGKIYRIKNRWTGQYLHVEYGTLQAGNVPTSWWSTRWKIENSN